MTGPGRSMRLEPAQRAQDAPIRRSGPGARDRRIAEIAARQWGVVEYAQLLAAGYSASAVQRAVCAGRLHPRFRGVYAVGHPALQREGAWLAAVLACGGAGAAALSCRSAGALWDLRSSSRPSIDVTVRTRRIAPSGLTVHHTARLSDTECTVHRGIPVTTVSRTLADLAAVLRPRDLERTLERAQSQHILDVPSLLACVANRPGAPVVRRILAEWEPVLTRSELEVALRRLVLRSGMAEPLVNARVGGFEVDLLWPTARLIAEADSLQFHLTRAAMERDRARDAVLAREGYRVLRFTDRQVRRRPAEVVQALRAAGV